MSQLSGAPAELVVAPVTITPTKPLTPTHIKGLLWTDVLVKASARVASVRLAWSRRMAALTSQSADFWQHLDRTEPDTDWSTEPAGRLGERYVSFHASRPKSVSADPRYAADPSYLARADRDGWVHPAGLRMLDHWRAELALLGVDAQGLTDDRPLAGTAELVLDALAERRLLIDHSRYGGPVHLDGARWGMPLRQLIGADGRPNYLLPILRELIPTIRADRAFLLVHDTDITADYLLLERVLAAFGARVSRLALSRVPVEGAARSSRYGGWAGATLTDLSAVSGSASRAGYRLGMRLYFAGVLHRRSAQSFRMPLLRRCVGRAARLLDGAPEGGDEATRRLVGVLARMRAQRGYVDPYRLTSSLLGERLLSPAVREIYT